MYLTIRQVGGNQQFTTRSLVFSSCQTTCVKSARGTRGFFGGAGAPKATDVACNHQSTLASEVAQRHRAPSSRPVITRLFLVLFSWSQICSPRLVSLVRWWHLVRIPLERWWIDWSPAAKTAVATHQTKTFRRSTCAIDILLATYMLRRYVPFGATCLARLNRCRETG